MTSSASCLVLVELFNIHATKSFCNQSTCPLLDTKKNACFRQQSDTFLICIINGWLIYDLYNQMSINLLTLRRFLVCGFRYEFYFHPAFACLNQTDSSVWEHVNSLNCTDGVAGTWKSSAGLERWQRSFTLHARSCVACVTDRSSHRSCNSKTEGSSQKEMSMQCTSAQTSGCCLTSALSGLHLLMSHSSTELCF